MTPAAAPPPPVRRLVRALLAAAVVAFGLAAWYGLYYVLDAAWGLGAPRLDGPASTLARAFVGVGVVGLAWALVLGLERLPSLPRPLAAARRDPRLVWAAAAALSVAYALARGATNVESPWATMDALVAGEASLPFQYRALVPLLVRAVSAMLPGVPAGALFGAVEAAAALGAYAAFGRLLRPHFGDRAGGYALALFYPLAVTLASPYRYNALFFPWDTLSLAFFTAGLWAIRERRWVVFYPLFVVATLNRETTCFLTVVYLLTSVGRVPARALVGHAAAQLALWAAVKGALWLAFQGNPVLDASGGLFTDQVARSLRLLTSPAFYVYLLFAMGGLWAVVLGLFRYLDDPWLRRALGVVPVFLVGMVFVGELMEVRIYTEMIPLVTAAALLILRSLHRARAHGDAVAA